MPKTIPMLLIGLFFGGGLGFFFAAANDITLTGHDHGSNDAHVAHTASLKPEDALPLSLKALGMTGDDLCSARPDANHSHDHDLLDVSGAGHVPTVTLRLHPDGSNSWNLEIATQNFRFVPEAVNGPHVPGEGHAHIYVDGVKLARAYGPWFQLSNIAPGAEVRVTLNAHSHEALANGDMPIAAKIIIPAGG